MTTKDLITWFKKHPFCTVCAVLSLVLAGFYFLRQGNGPEATALLADRMSESSRLKANVTNSALLAEHVTALEEANGKVAQRLVRPADVARNQQYFYKIESESGVKLLDLRAGGSGASSAAKVAAGPKKLYSPVPYTCTVQGTHAQILAFLRMLESGEHFQRVVAATLNLSGGGSVEDESADPLLTLSLSIELLGQSQS